jgi:Uma2 family endonuclease
MVHPAKSDRLVSVDEYLALEEASPIRHEYLAGEVYALYALAGASIPHNQIAGNIFSALRAAARGGPCRITMSDVKVRADEKLFYYPDVMTVCESGGHDRLVVTKPCLLVEVTSPSTETIDRREKLFAYRRIESLKAYIIVAQDERWVERYWRDEDGIWHQATLWREGRILLPCPETEMTLDEIYEGV